MSSKDIDLGEPVEVRATMGDGPGQVRLLVFPKMVREGKDPACIFYLPDGQRVQPHTRSVDLSVHAADIEGLLVAMQECFNLAVGRCLLPAHELAEEG